MLRVKSSEWIQERYLPKSNRVADVTDVNHSAHIAILLYRVILRNDVSHLNSTVQYKPLWTIVFIYSIVWIIIHYRDVTVGSTASQITSLTIVYSAVYSGTDQRKPKLHVTGLCAGNSPVTVEFPAQMASDTENVSIWWRHHALKARLMPIFFKFVYLFSNPSGCRYNNEEK